MSSPISSELASAAFRKAEIRPVEVTMGASTYQATVGPDALDRLGEWLDRAGLGGRPRIIADARVWAVHGQRIETSLRATGRDARVALVPSGEEQKSLAGAERLYDWLLEVGTDRGDCIIAIGGGVVGDLGGFVAATFLRGLRLVQVPTTLLAQVDSSIGGKVAVNHRLGKNLIGAFHQPSLVVSDTNILRGLPEREYRAGWAEIVKIAMIQDADLFRVLQAHVDSLLAFGDEALLGDVIRRAVELKALVVGEDEREDGRRVILNYGHTVGHALEAATGYHRYLHGEAVAIGMAAAGFLANRRGVLSDAALAEQAALLAAFGLPPRGREARGRAQGFRTPAAR
jgi:3-dehydroquinate synthase